MDRFFASPEQWEEQQVVLSDEESHHCLRVMRKRVGDRVEVFDGKGRWGQGVLSEEGGRASIRLEQEGTTEALSPLIGLAVAVPKGKTMDLLVQKAVELGVGAIQPLLTENTVVRVNEEEGLKKRAKWQRVVFEACKQCGQNHLPKVAPPRALSDWLELREVVPALVASLAPGALSLRSAVDKIRPSNPSRLEVVVGPEGDFAGAEMMQLLEHSVVPVTLGPLTLRVETAVFSLLGVLRYEFGL